MRSQYWEIFITALVDVVAGMPELYRAIQEQLAEQEAAIAPVMEEAIAQAAEVAVSKELQPQASFSHHAYEDLTNWELREQLNKRGYEDAITHRLPVHTKAPNYQYPIEVFSNFDWESIGAAVVQQDQYGAGVVSWGGKDWVRCSPANKYGAAIWFSRATGVDDKGEPSYERLITFKPRNTSVEPIPQKVANLINFERQA